MLLSAMPFLEGGGRLPLEFFPPYAQVFLRNFHLS
jgi:hypothetical protein